MKCYYYYIYWIGITLKTNDEFKKEKRIKIIKRIIALVILEGIAVNGNYGAFYFSS